MQTITPHDLPHTCASLAVSSGANVLAVSRMLGHKDPSVTLRIYADLFDSDLDAVAVNLDARIAVSVQRACGPAPQSPEKCSPAAVMLQLRCVSEGGLGHLRHELKRSNSVLDQRSRGWRSGHLAPRVGRGLFGPHCSAVPRWCVNTI